MDPLTLVLSALTAGAATLAKGALSNAGKDAYERLKSMIAERASDSEEASLVLKKFDDKPEIWQGPVRELLIEEGIHEDTNALEQARDLLKIVQPQQVAQGKFNINIGESKGTTIGDSNTVTQNFGRDE